MPGSQFFGRTGGLARTAFAGNVFGNQSAFGLAGTLVSRARRDVAHGINGHSGAVAEALPGIDVALVRLDAHSATPAAAVLAAFLPDTIRAAGNIAGVSYAEQRVVAGPGAGIRAGTAGSAAAVGTTVFAHAIGLALAMAGNANRLRSRTLAATAAAAVVPAFLARAIRTADLGALTGKTSDQRILEPRFVEHPVSQFAQACQIPRVQPDGRANFSTLPAQFLKNLQGFGQTALGRIVRVHQQDGFFGKQGK